MEVKCKADPVEFVQAISIARSQPGVDKAFFEPDGGMEAYVEKVSSLKQIAHAFQVNGKVKLGSRQIELEGALHNQFRRLFQRSLQAFAEEYTGISSLEKDCLITLIDQREETQEAGQPYNFTKGIFQSVDRLFEDFQQGKAVSLSSGYTGHSVIVSFEDNYLLIANKGGETRRPVEVYQIDRQKVTKQHFQEILDLMREDKALTKEPKEAYNKWYGSLSNKFHATKNSLCLCIEQAYPFSSYQYVGNCVWESLQTSVYGSLLLNRLKNGYDKLTASEKKIVIADTNKVFQQWQEFLKLVSLARYVTTFKATSIENLDQNLLRKIFRQYWSSHPIFLPYIEKMESLETEYMKKLQGLSLTFAKAERHYYHKLRSVPYVVQDLTKVWIPSVLSTGASALAYHFHVPKIIQERLFGNLLLSSYGFSLIQTVRLARRHFAI